MILLITTLEPSRLPFLPQFVAHYRKLGVERFILSLHLDPMNGAEAAAQARAAFKTTLERLGIEEAYYYEGAFLMEPFYLYQSTLQSRLAKDEDWIVWADIDEFQVYPRIVLPLSRMVSGCEKIGVNHVDGLLVDRIAADGGLPEFDPERPIWDQYPITCFVSKKLANAELRKVTLAKGWVQLAYGNHVPAIKRPHQAPPLRFAEAEHPKLQAVQGWIQVHHFKWDAGLIARLRLRTTPEFMAKYGWSVEGQRLFDYLQARDMKFDLKDVAVVRLNGAKFLRRKV